MEMKFVEVWEDEGKTRARLVKRKPTPPPSIKSKRKRAQHLHVYSIGEGGDFENIYAFIDYYMSDPFYHNEKWYVYSGLISGDTVEINY